jgi:predicted transcriptional regulator
MSKKDNQFTKTLRFHGISKRELGTELNLSQPTIKSYCDNPQLFRLNQLKTIGKLTDLKLDDLDNLINGTSK